MPVKNKTKNYEYGLFDNAFMSLFDNFFVDLFYNAIKGLFVKW